MLHALTGGFDTRLIDFDVGKLVFAIDILSFRCVNKVHPPTVSICPTNCRSMLLSSCRKLIMLSIFSVMLACSREPRRAFEEEIADNTRALAYNDHCGDTISSDLLGKVHHRRGQSGEWSLFAGHLKSHLMNLMRRHDLIRQSSPCKMKSSNFSVARHGVLGALRNLLVPSAGIPML